MNEPRFYVTWRTAKNELLRSQEPITMGEACDYTFEGETIVELQAEGTPDMWIYATDINGTRTIVGKLQGVCHA
jgi:hypothetical protein